MQQVRTSHRARNEQHVSGGTSRRTAYVRALRVVVPVTLGMIAVLMVLGVKNDVAAAVSHPAARAWFTVGHSVLRTALMVAFAAFTINRDAPVRRARNPLAYLACALAIGTVVMYTPAPSTPAGLILAGDLIALVFSGWVLASALTLRHYFSVLPEARGLVTKGPYAAVRHPVYLGELGVCAGLVIGTPSIINLAMFGAFVLAQSVRMGFEERALAAAFPEYRDYAARTPRLVPSFWRGRRSVEPGLARAAWRRRSSFGSPGAGH